MINDNIPEVKRKSNIFVDIDKEGSVREITDTLKKLGKLKNNDYKDTLISLADHNNEKVRYYAIKNLGKYSDMNLFPLFSSMYKSESSTLVRREIVSSIGRLRSKKTIPLLKKIIDDRDPKVIMQAIRGLLVFKKDEDVNKTLLKMKDHPNEIIREVIEIELLPEENNTKTKGSHTKAPNYLKNIVVNEDVRKVLKVVPDNSIHLTFTSPPYYNARDYSIYRSYKEYLNVLSLTFKEVHRITKEGRFFILNTSPIIIPRFSRSHASKRYPIPFDIHHFLTEMGWEFIDDIVWVKPEASAKKRNAGFLQHRKPLGYKPNPISEMLMVYRKKTRKLIDWNIRQYDLETTKNSKVLGDYETSNVWYIDPTFDKVHTAVFPEELCDRVIKYYSYVGDLVFDPFAGRGTLGKSAKNLKRHFFLVEKNITYVDRMKKYLNGQQNLFSNEFSVTSVLSLNELKERIINDTNKS